MLKILIPLNEYEIYSLQKRNKTNTKTIRMISSTFKKSLKFLGHRLKEELKFNLKIKENEINPIGWLTQKSSTTKIFKTTNHKRDQ